jgi:hypothetical protein
MKPSLAHFARVPRNLRVIPQLETLEERAGPTSLLALLDGPAAPEMSALSEAAPTTADTALGSQFDTAQGFSVQATSAAMVSDDDALAQPAQDSTVPSENGNTGDALGTTLVAPAVPLSGLPTIFSNPFDGLLGDWPQPLASSIGSGGTLQPSVGGSSGGAGGGGSPGQGDSGVMGGGSGVNAPFANAGAATGGMPASAPSPSATGSTLVVSGLPSGPSGSAAPNTPVVPTTTASVLPAAGNPNSAFVPNAGAPDQGSATGTNQPAGIADQASSPPLSQAAAQDFSNLPLRFEPNLGQTSSLAAFTVQGGGYQMFLTSSGEAVFGINDNMTTSNSAVSSGAASDESLPKMAAPGAVQTNFFGMQLVDANPAPQTELLDQLPGVSNYLIGNDPTQWQTNVPGYGEVVYQDVWPGIDVAFHASNQNNLEYDFIVNPGADPSQIQLAWQGVDAQNIDSQGNLQLTVAGQTIEEQAPNLYQDVNGARVSVGGSFALEPNGQVAFNVDSYAADAPLVIDPVLAYSTYLAGAPGSYFDQGRGIAVDSQGSAYVVGTTYSSSFPVTPGSFQTSAISTWGMAFVSKLDPTGSRLAYSTYLGGSGYGIENYGMGVALDAAGDAYVTGSTTASNFPTKAGAFQASRPSGEEVGFVTELNPSGAGLVYSTYLGLLPGDRSVDWVASNAIALDSQGDAFVAGEATGSYFPTTLGAFQVSNGPYAYSGFVTKFTPNGSGLLYSTYLGGSQYGYAEGIALDSAGDAYVSGLTNDSDFPTENAWQPAIRDGRSGFLTKFFRPTLAGATTTSRMAWLWTHLEMFTWLASRRRQIFSRLPAPTRSS